MSWQTIDRVSDVLQTRVHICETRSTSDALLHGQKKFVVERLRQLQHYCQLQLQFVLFEQLSVQLCQSFEVVLFEVTQNLFELPQQLAICPSSYLCEQPINGASKPRIFLRGIQAADGWLCRMHSISNAYNGVNHSLLRSLLLDFG